MHCKWIDYMFSIFVIVAVDCEFRRPNYRIVINYGKESDSEFRFQFKYTHTFDFPLQPQHTHCFWMELKTEFGVQLFFVFNYDSVIRPSEFKKDWANEPIIQLEWKQHWASSNRLSTEREDTLRLARVKDSWWSCEHRVFAWHAENPTECIETMATNNKNSVCLQYIWCIFTLHKMQTAERSASGWNCMTFLCFSEAR